jgi:hypothetical protein
MQSNEQRSQWSSVGYECDTAAEIVGDYASVSQKIQRDHSKVETRHTDRKRLAGLNLKRWEKAGSGHHRH